MDPDPSTDSELSRDLSLFQVTMLGVGMMIGAGVFVLTGIGIGIAGPGGILMAFALNGIVALLCTMAYAELASAMPEAGGGYTFVREGLGGITGFLSGWMSWLGHTVAGSLYSIAFATYTIHLLEELQLIQLNGMNQLLVEKGIAVITALIFVYVNYRGASETGMAGSIMALGQMAVLGAIGIIGIVVAAQNPGRLANFDPFLPNGWGKILVTMGFTYIGFEGYEVIAQAGEEVKEPRENIPKAIFYALIAVVTTYLLVAFAALIGVHSTSTPAWQWIGSYGSTGFARAISQLLPFGGLLVTLAAIFSSTSALNATTYSSTRVSFALGRDGHLPKVLSRISKKRKIPDVALLLSGVLIVVFAATLPVEDVAASADIMFLLLFLLVNFSVIKLRQERGREFTYGYLIPLFPFVPILAIILHLILSVWLFDMSTLAWITTALWLVGGVAIYFFYSRHQPAIKKPKTQIVSQKRALKERDYQILVPVANPENASFLVNYAGTIARARKAEILLISMVTVPEQTPLSEADQFVSEKQKTIDQAINEAPSGVPVHSTIRYGHDIARGIISAVKEHRSNLLVMGWSGKLKEGGFQLGDIVDPVIEGSPCDSMVIKPGVKPSRSPPSSILCPITGGPHSGYVLEVANMIAKGEDADVTILHVRREDESYEDAQWDMHSNLTSSDLDENTRVKVIEAGDQSISDRIIEESKGYDLVMIGATREGLFDQLLFGTVPERVAAGCDSTVIMSKKYLGLRSWIQRWLGTYC